MSLNKTTFKAFTLVEILIVIAILAILAVITLAALNPAARIQAANDSQTRSSVQGVCTAFSLYVVDNNGSLPTTDDPTAGTALPSTSGASDTITNGVTLSTIEQDLSAYGIDTATVTVPGGSSDTNIYIGAGSGGQINCAAYTSSGTFGVTE